MSLHGYFNKSKRELRMPKGKDKLGIIFTGEVLTGHQSVEGQRKEEELREAQRQAQADAGFGPAHRPITSYDPVLDSHCRVADDHDDKMQKDRLGRC